mgnify:CR=1 FL=1
MKIAFLKHLNAGLVTPAAEAACRKAGVIITNTGRDVVLTIQDFNGGSRLTASLPATGLTTAKAVRPLLRRLAARQAAYTEALDAAWEDEEVRFGPSAADCGKDGLAAKLRQVNRPAPGVAVPLATKPAPVVTYSRSTRA